MGYTNNVTPVFDGQNYEIWISRMKVFLEAQQYDVLNLVVIGYTTSKKPPKTIDKKELIIKKLAMDVILDGLPDSIKVKVGQCSSTIDIWDKLHNIYSKKYLLVIIETNHADKNKEYVEI
jgi:hypothetical protein